jgi:hypothetical protein
MLEIFICIYLYFISFIYFKYLVALIIARSIRKTISHAKKWCTRHSIRHNFFLISIYKFEKNFDLYFFEIKYFIKNYFNNFSIYHVNLNFEITRSSAENYPVFY